MLILRKSGDRGQADLGWLKSRHSFSFADYVDPDEMGWGNLADELSVTISEGSDAEVLVFDLAP